jgi:predicted acylesterase/phospholipase RssA
MGGKITVNEKRPKRAITLAGRGPAAGLHIGVLECLKGAGIEFDVWALSCIGAWVGIVYNQAENGEEIEHTYDFFRNEVFRDDASYRGFPLNAVSTPDWRGNADALTHFLQQPKNYQDLFLPEMITESFGRTTSILSGESRKWDEGDRNRWLLNDVLAVNPLIRFWSSLMFKSNIDGLSKTHYPHSTLIKNIKFERLYEHRRPYILHNAWNISKQELQLFSNKKGRYKPISAASMCACSSRPFVDQPIEIDGDQYCEGSLVDTVNFETLLQVHPDLDEIWIIRIGDAQQYRNQKTYMMPWGIFASSTRQHWRKVTSNYSNII